MTKVKHNMTGMAKKHTALTQKHLHTFCSIMLLFKLNKRSFIPFRMCYFLFAYKVAVRAELENVLLS